MVKNIRINSQLSKIELRKIRASKKREKSYFLFFDYYGTKKHLLKIMNILNDDGN